VANIADFLSNLGVVLTPYAWATHILLGLAIQIVVALALQAAGVRNAWWIAAALSIGFWWGRKKFEFEYMLRAAAHLQTVGPFWYRGWLPLEWPLQRQLEFYAPAAAIILVALLADRLRKRPAS
jgi:hypothetical protein